jgi:hypothetical protein
MSKMPRIEEWLVRYKTLSTIIIKHSETFIGRAMRWPNILKRISIRVVLPEVELSMGRQCKQGYPYKYATKSI